VDGGDGGDTGVVEVLVLLLEGFETVLLVCGKECGGKESVHDVLELE
jgi:hypothetical protein